MNSDMKDLKIIPFKWLSEFRELSKQLELLGLNNVTDIKINVPDDGDVKVTLTVEMIMPKKHGDTLRTALTVTNEANH